MKFCMDCGILVEGCNCPDGPFTPLSKLPKKLLPCPCCGKEAHIVCDNGIFKGQDHSDRYPPLVAKQSHGFQVECFDRCLMTCWWHYDSEAIFVWNNRIEE